MRKAQIASVLSLGLLGLLGGCLILAQGGFTSSGKRGGWSVFIPPPQVYVMAAIMFALSLLAVLCLLKEVQAKRATVVYAFIAYCGAAAALTTLLSARL